MKILVDSAKLQGVVELLFGSATLGDVMFACNIITKILKESFRDSLNRILKNQELYK